MTIENLTNPGQPPVDGDFIRIEYDNGSSEEKFFYTPAVTPDPAPTPVRTLTKLQYMNRFTDDELAGIYTAAKSNVAVEIWLEKFKLASEVNLDDASTVAGLQAMEVVGLLAPGRSTEILA